MIRTLFKLAGMLLFAKNIASGDPKRIVKYAVRRQAHKSLARVLRGL